ADEDSNGLLCAFPDFRFQYSFKQLKSTTKMTILRVTNPPPLLLEAILAVVSYFLLCLIEYCS
ncbi:hypothetical protein, partial [Alkalibacillus haloalkaliphilus]|uniref:hypothetical protein n=1 Tax=Alkalibacillus haloalkaliphilus TaxID=94136 RepID=UPI0029357ECC